MKNSSILLIIFLLIVSGCTEKGQNPGISQGDSLCISKEGEWKSGIDGAEASGNSAMNADDIDYQSLDSMLSYMTKFENQIKYRKETKDISWEYYKEMTGKDKSALGDVGDYFKVIKRIYDSKNICLIYILTIDEEFFDHKHLQDIYVLYKNGLLSLISVDNAKSDDFLTTMDSNTFKCDGQRFYFDLKGKCIRALEKKYEYIDSPELPSQYIDSLSKHTPYIESNCTMGDSIRNELTKLLERY